MIRYIYSLLLFGYCAIALAQFNNTAPWMTTLSEDNTAKISKSFDASSRYTGLPSISKTIMISNANYSLPEMNEAFEEYWKDKDPKAKGSGYKPYKRWETFWKKYADKDGYLPSSKDIWSAWSNKINFARTANADSNWTNYGPETSDIIPGNLPGQGRVNNITIDPKNADIWYVGTPSGGIWKSIDAGDNWLPLTDKLPRIGVASIVIDPTNSDIIYISTGDDESFDTPSAGIFKSTDGGNTWNRTGVNTDNTPRAIPELIIHPTMPNILWASTSVGIIKTTDGGQTWNFSLSTTDGIRDFKMKPNDPTTFYATTYTDPRLYRSTDGGDSFSEVSAAKGAPQDSGRIVIGVSPKDPNVVYVLSSKNRANKFAYQGIYKSTDSGATFSRTSNNRDILESNQAWFDLAIAVDPQDINHIYTGCLNIFESTDGGNSFSSVNNWTANNQSYTHADIHHLHFQNNKLFCGSDGGIYVSDDNGVSFTSKTKGLSISQFYRISVAADDHNKIVGGLQDNGSYVRDNNKWNIFHGGDGTSNTITANDEVYSTTQFGGFIFKSDLKGNISNAIQKPATLGGGFIVPLQTAVDGTVYAGYNRIAEIAQGGFVLHSGSSQNPIDHMVVDPVNANKIYVAIKKQLFVTTDRGDSYSLLYTFGDDINDFDVNNVDPNKIYVITLDNVFQSEDNGKTFTSIRDDLPTDQGNSCITHQDGDVLETLYLGTSLGVFKKNNTSSSWEAYDNNLPNVPIRNIKCHIPDRKVIVATFGRGVWVSPLIYTDPDFDVQLVSSENLFTHKIIKQTITPIIKVKNGGKKEITQLKINYSLDQGDTNTYNWKGSLTKGQETLITLPNLTITENETKNHEITIDAILENDQVKANNSITIPMISQIANGITNETYTFEADNGGFIAYADKNTIPKWEYGEVNNFLKGLQTSGTKAYVLDHSNYPSLSKSYLLSPFYALDKIKDHSLEFNMSYALKNDGHVLYMQYSTDFGKSWHLLQDTDNNSNWYNNSSNKSNSCVNCVGGQWISNNTTITDTYSLSLTSSTLSDNNSNDIIFRWVFHSLGSNTNSNNGILVDDFIIKDPKTYNPALAQDNINENDLIPFPNPASDVINLANEEFDNKDFSFAIYNLEGKLISQNNTTAKDNTITIDINRLRPGVYLIYIKNDDISPKITKFVKQ